MFVNTQSTNSTLHKHHFKEKDTQLTVLQLMVMMANIKRKNHLHFASRLAFSKRSVPSRSNSEGEYHSSAGSGERKAAFQFNAYTLWATMAGQKWPEGDRHFYGRLHVPVLLICGRHDRLVSEAEEEEALFVGCILLVFIFHTTSLFSSPQSDNVKAIHWT